MKFKARVIDPVGLGAAIGAALMATLTLLPQARGEVVFENDVDQGPVEIRPIRDDRALSRSNDPRGEDRRVLRQALGTSEKARATRASEIPVAQLAPAPAQLMIAPAQVVAAPVVVGESAMVAAAPAAEPVAMPLENLSKTELMRRERVREELRNEDAIQERLEQLRLRDERRRSDSILKGSVLPGSEVAGQPVGVPALQDEAVVAPVTERHGLQAAGAAGVAPLNPALQNTAADPASSVATGSPVSEDADEEKTQVSIRPMGGVSNMSVSGAFEVKPRYTLGAAVGVVSSENISFELGYAYSDYGIRAATTNPLVAYGQSVQAYQGFSNPETLGLHQNVFDAGLKVAMLNSTSKIRPFIGGGAGYEKSYVNYTSAYTQLLDQYGATNLSRDYESSAFLGYLSTGFDVKVNKSLTLGGQFKYYGVLSSRENADLSVNGFYANQVNPALLGADTDKRVVGTSLSESSFYSILGTASFVF